MVLVVKSRRCWDVKTPPPKKQTVAGRQVPTVRNVATLGLVKGHKRRVCVEVRGEVEDADGYEKVPSTSLPSAIKDFPKDDFILVRTLRPRRERGLRKDRDGNEKEEEEEEDDPEESQHTKGDTPVVGEDDSLIPEMEEDGFVELRQFTLDDFEEREDQAHSNTIEVTMGLGDTTVVRDVHFISEDECQDFINTVNKLRSLEEQRAKQQVKAFRKENRGDNCESVMDSLGSFDEEISILIEVVSATHLPVADLISSDPYVVVWLGRREVHRTKPIWHTLEPVWTINSGSLFILNTTAREFFSASNGLLFQVMDFDTVGANDLMGQVYLSQRDLLNGKGERVEHDLDVGVAGFSKSGTFVHRPRLNLRARPATEDDAAFLRTLSTIQRKIGKNKKMGVYASEAFLAPSSHPGKVLKRGQKKAKDGTPLHRVKPFPDPDRPEEETMWLTKPQIEKEYVKPSTKWIEVGSGTLGRIYLEVLKCQGLPNMDGGPAGLTGVAMNNFTDSFVCIIYEDAIVNTEVIYDELSPRWMPWTQRAFIFNMSHPSSQLLLGVFDYDRLSENDPIGRISIDLSNLASSTDYTLTYTLYSSVLDDVRPPVGTVTVRLRMETGSFRNEVLATLNPPPMDYVNLTKKGEFETARFVTSGEENLHKLDMDAIKSYVHELASYMEILYYIEQALYTVLLWRGHFGPVEVCGHKFKLALHSMIAFTLGVFIVEDYDRFPAFVCFCVAWFLLATNEQRQRNPSPWHKSATFRTMWMALVLDTPKANNRDMTITDEMKPLISEYEHKLEAAHKRQEERIELAQKAMKGNLSDFYGEEDSDDEAEAEAMETKQGGFQLNVLKPILLPIQEILGQICVVLRITKAVVVWDEPIIAFLLVNAAIAAGFATLWIPWGWMIRWMLRFIVWGLLGPHMKLVDIYFVRKLEEDGDNPAKEALSFIKEQSRLLMAHNREVMIYREKAIKMRAFKRYCFGKYVLRVPQFKEYRYPDVPLPESEAEPHVPGSSSIRVSGHRHGMRLSGDMIPAWGDEEDGQGTFSKATAREGDGALKKINPLRLIGVSKSVVIAPAEKDDDEENENDEDAKGESPSKDDAKDGENKALVDPNAKAAGKGGNVAASVMKKVSPVPLFGKLKGAVTPPSKK